MKIGAIIVAAGSSVRFGGDVPKQFRQVCGRPLLSWTISRFQASQRVSQIIVVVAEEHLLFAAEKVVDPFRFDKVTNIVKGGDTRQESVARGLAALPISTEYVAIHDGARPLTSTGDIDRVIDTAVKERAAILAVPVADTVKRAADGYVIATLDRSRLYGAQTPQVFQYDLIIESHQAMETGDCEFSPTDDSELIEARGFKVKLVEPEDINLKVTTRDDLAIVEAILLRDNND
ncbi:MAG: 2-C-methyl-D-erythritol 4-phosphate cytidylyltransferase [candidate division Zixibacteria bacterium]|nr:2-C-methyl-D-erythritol 4-phosphate cytidylyltransferase [candidate division Zixibacteria bacterium]